MSVTWKGLELCCPACRGDLREEGASEPELRCDACDRTYPIILGIPDLRIFRDPYIDIEADRAKGRAIAERWDDLTFAELVEHYYRMTSVVTAEQARAFTAGLLSAPARAAEALRAWEGPPPARPAGSMLEIGCGTAPLLLAARDRWTRVAGVDIAFRWLCVARKRLAEANADLPLICACAEALPLRDASFERVIGDAVIENVRDAGRTLAEAHRVLVPGGRIHLSTTNRFSIGPDPQTGIWAVGWLPKRVTDARVRRGGGIPPVRSMLGARALGAKMRRAGFDAVRLALPTFPAEQQASFPPLVRRLVAGYHLASRLPLSRQLLFLLGPKLLATGSRRG